MTAETTSGGQASVSNTGEAPDVYIADAVVDDSSGNSQLEVAFNATGEIAADDVQVTVNGPKDTFYKVKEPNAEEGTVTVTIPENTFGGGDLTFSARLWNSSAGGGDTSLNASDDASVEFTSPVTLVDYSLNTTSVYSNESFEATATVENTGDTEENFTVALYDDTGDVTYPKSSTTTSIAAGNTEKVELTTSYRSSGEYDVRINNESATTVSVESRVDVTDITVRDDGVGVGETVKVDVTLDNPTDKEGSKWLSYYLGSASGYDSYTVAANSEETITLEKAFEEPGEKFLSVDGVQKNAYVLNDTEGTANLTVSTYYDHRSVVAGNEVYFSSKVTNHGNASGVREVSLDVDGETVANDTVYVEQNETEYAFLSTTFEDIGSYTATIDGSHEVNVTVRDTVVQPESVSIEHVNGTAPDSMPNVDAAFSSRGWVWVDVRNGNGGYDLAELGADDSTVFEMNLTVEDYTPRVLVSSGQDLNWTVTDNADGTKTISIRASPAQFEYMTDAPRLENWDDAENDQADFSMDAAMFIGIDDANRSEVYGEDTEDLTGMTVATDAQTFLPPQYYPGSDDEPPRLEIQLAGPHLTKAGNVNDGHYEAFLPDRLLDAWEVTDPEQLTAAYSDSEDVEFTTTEVDGGVRVRLDLHYSSGTVSISKAESDDDSGGSVGSVGGGGVGDADDDTTTTTTETTTTTAADESTTTADERTTAPETTTDAPSDTTTETTAVDATTAATSTTTEATTGETTSDGTTELDRTTTEPTENGGGTPGFGAGVAVTALASALIALRRRTAS